MSLGTRKTKTEGSGNVLRRRRTILAWGFALPFVVVFCVFMLIPLLSSMAMSFTDITSKDLRTPFNVNFVGLDQYIALFHDRRFLHALGVTGIFVLVGLPITMVIALAFAVALNKGSKHLNAFFRAVFYAPVVASVVAVSVVWRYILQKDGLLNSLLAVFGIAGPDWLHDTRYALPALMVMTIWRNMGTLMIIFLAGLQAIPEELKEAARVDGAGELRIFFQIVLPQCGPPLATLSILTFLSSWNNFLWPLVAAQTEEKYTLPVALSLYSTGQNATNYSVLLAGAVLVVTPILLLFVFLQRYFIQGVAGTGIK